MDYSYEVRFRLDGVIELLVIEQIIMRKLSIRFDLGLLDAIKSILDDNNLSLKGIYKINKEGIVRIAKKIK